MTLVNKDYHNVDILSSTPVPQVIDTRGFWLGRKATIVWYWYTRSVLADNGWKPSRH